MANTAKDNETGRYVSAAPKRAKADAIAVLIHEVRELRAKVYGQDNRTSDELDEVAGDTPEPEDS